MREFSDDRVALSGASCVRIGFGGVFGEASLGFEDGEMAKRIARVFSGVALPNESYSSCDFRIASRMQRHKVFLRDGSRAAACSSEAQLVGSLDAIFDARLREPASVEICAVHSSCVEVANGLVAFTGVSGSGKTTLALACAMRGLPHAGDEFGLLNMNTGMFCQAEYPVALKSALPIAAISPNIAEGSLEAVSPFGIASRLHSRSEILALLHARRAAASEWRPLVAIVSVERKNCIRPHIEDLQVSDWVGRLMPSIDAPVSRGELFSRLLSLPLKAGVRVLRLEYDDAFDAACLVDRYFR